MAGSVVSVTLGSRVTGTTQASVAVTGVATSDVILLVEGTNAVTTGFATSFSGLGASWSLVSGSQATTFGVRFWVGTSPSSSSGTITGSGGGNAGSDGRAVTAYILRGVTHVDIAATSVAASPTASPTLVSADADDVVIGAGYSDTSFWALDTFTPSTGWTSQSPTDLWSSSRWYNTAHRLPTSTADHGVTAYRPSGTANAAVVVVKAAAGTGSVVSIDATAPLPAVAFQVSAAVVVAVDATAPLPDVTFGIDAGTSSTVTAAIDATAPAPVVDFTVVVGGQDGQETYPTRAYARLGYLTIPPAALPPAGVTPRPIQRRSHVVPVLTGATAPLTEGVDYPAVDPVDVGELHVFVGDEDVTYRGGIPIQALQYSKVGPLGDVAASFELPGMQAWDKPGVGEFAAIDPSTDAPVEAVIIDDEGNRTHLFKGFLSADRAQVGESKRNGFTAEGVLWQAGHTIHEPPHYLPPTDIGTLIPRLLNSVPSRRYNDVPEVVTGLMTRHRGAGNQYVDQVILDILAKDGWTDDGQQWTLEQVGPDDFRMVLKPATDGTYDDTVTYGAFGIDVSLSREQTSRADVIYGRGVTAAGGQWRGTRFPGLILANPLPYPNGDARSMHLGDTDGDTDSGTGVSDWQRRMNELGYGLRVDGTLNSNDIDVVRRLQRSMGLLVDGVIGPQTWAGSFNRGPEGIDLSQWREPIAWESWTQPYLRDPNGVILSDNPDYDSTRIPHQIEVDFGAPITWREAQPPSRRMLAVESTAGLTGTIRMRTDFHNSWRGLARPGMRVRVLGFQGESPVVRVAAVDAGVDADGFYVDLTVDERARDALSVDQILERNRAAMADPARRPGNPNRDSRNERDRFVQWDIDSPCGFMPRTAVFGGLWVAPNPIPFSEVGRIVRIVMSSTVPFCMGIFGLPVKPSQVQAIVGNPLADSDPWRPHTDALDKLGWIDGWGSQDQRMGYYPGDEGSDYPFTGKTDLRGAWDYISGYPPYVWPLFYSATTGFIGGGSGDWVSRFYPATGD